MTPTLLTDYYKLSHPRQYPSGTEFVYSNTTPRSSRKEEIKEVVVFGIQYLLKEYLLNQFNDNFFSLPKDKAIGEIQRITDATLGPNSVDVKLFGDLHDLGYLPLHIKALPEGTKCPLQVPFMTIVNTDKRFYWLTNFVETMTQTVTWAGITSATIADQFKKLLTKYAAETSDAPDFVNWQGHDFSMRGMSSIESGKISGAAHLLSFTGTDTIPAIMFLEKYYGANVERELVGGSVPATEHAVMCAGGEEDEYGTYERLITEVYPSGIVSIVSDTWDYWHVLTETLPKLKDKILARNGKVVIRPDSGDPIKIVCGYFPYNCNIPSADVIRKIGDGSTVFSRSVHEKSEEGYDALKCSDGVYLDFYGDVLTEAEVKGSIQILFDIFGGSENSKGYLDLDSHIGLIYGDGITLTRCEKICEQLKRKGFSSTNVVFGIGSYTYQYNTRDEFGIACKATWVQINGVTKEIFKAPKTGSSKKSAKGLLQVHRNTNGKLVLKECCTPEEEKCGELVTVFLDGKLHNENILSDIRKRLLT